MGDRSHRPQPWYSAGDRAFRTLPPFPFSSVSASLQYQRSHGQGGGPNNVQPHQSLPSRGPNVKRKASNQTLGNQNKVPRPSHPHLNEQNRPRSQDPTTSKASNYGSIGSRDCPILIDVEDQPALSGQNSFRMPDRSGPAPLTPTSRDNSSSSRNQVDQDLQKAILNSVSDTRRPSLLSVDGFRRQNITAAPLFQPYGAPNASSSCGPSSNTSNQPCNSTGSRSNDTFSWRTTHQTTSGPVCNERPPSNNATAGGSRPSDFDGAQSLRLEAYDIPIRTSDGRSTAPSPWHNNRTTSYHRKPSIAPNAASNDQSQAISNAQSTSRSQGSISGLTQDRNPFPTSQNQTETISRTIQDEALENDPPQRTSRVVEPQPRTSPPHRNSPPAQQNPPQHTTRPEPRNNHLSASQSTVNQEASHRLGARQKRIDEILKRRNKRGGIFSISVSDNEISEEPLPTGPIDRIGRDEANVLMNRSNVQSGSQHTSQNLTSQSQEEPASQERVPRNFIPPRPFGSTIFNAKRSHRKKAAYSSSQEYTRRKLEPHEVTDNDWLMLNLRNQGWEWKEIRAAWPEFTGISDVDLKSSDWFRRRFWRMRTTYPDLVTHPRDQKDLRQETINATTARNEAIAQDMRDATQRPDVIFMPDPPVVPTSETESSEDLEAKLARIRDFAHSKLNSATQSSHGSVPTPSANVRLPVAQPSETSRPTTSGKYISEDLKNYMLATLDRSDDDFDSGSELGEDRSDIDTAWRDNSPFKEEDQIHFIYHVWRREVPAGEDEEDVDWSICSESFESIKEANKAATNEVKNLSFTQVDLSPLTSWASEICESTGMATFLGTGRNGTLEVGVHRSMRTVHDGIMPQNKIGWLKSDIHDAMLKKTLYEETVEYADETSEWGEDTIEEREVEIDEQGNINEIQQCPPENTPQDPLYDSAYSSQSGSDDAEKTQEIPNTQSAQFDNLFDETSDNGDAALLPPNSRRKIILRTVTKTRTVTRPKTLIKATREIEMPIGDISAVKDRANRIAAEEYLQLKKELNPDPEARRAHMKNWEADQKAKKEMDKRLDELEEEYGTFEDTVEYSRGFGEGDDDEGSEERTRSKVTAEVKVVERVLLNPRNF